MSHEHEDDIGAGGWGAPVAYTHHRLQDLDRSRHPWLCAVMPATGAGSDALASGGSDGVGA